MKYRLLEPAQRELQAAIDYYERESPGLGGRFLDEFELTLERILQFPQAWARISENHNRCPAVDPLDHCSPRQLLGP